MILTPQSEFLCLRIYFAFWRTASTSRAILYVSLPISFFPVPRLYNVLPYQGFCPMQTNYSYQQHYYAT